MMESGLLRSSHESYDCSECEFYKLIRDMNSPCLTSRCPWHRQCVQWSRQLSTQPPSVPNEKQLQLHII